MAAVRRVLIVFAMEQEAEPFIRRHELCTLAPSPFPVGMPFVAHSNSAAESAASEIQSPLQVFTVWNGRDRRYGGNNVATTAASVCAYASIQAFAPDLVISAGTAGGFGGSGTAVGDVFLSTKCVFHARRIPDESGALEEQGFGHFRSPHLPRLAHEAQLKRGVVSTGDSLHTSALDLELLVGEGAAVKDMEAAAIAWVCEQLGVPFVAIKSVTDLIDGAHKSHDEFYSNLATASEALQEKLSRVLELVHGRPLSHWKSGPALQSSD